MGLVCPKCNQPLSVNYARDFQRKSWIAPGYKDYGAVIIRVNCPKHGTMKQKLNPFNKETWMDDFYEAILRCTKCDRIGTIANVQAKGPWVLFKINCPNHGLGGIKQVTSPLYFYITELQKQGITYIELIRKQPPRTFVVCPKCKHIVAPDHKSCDQCGTSLIPE
jgi:uncharacterized protein YbaR (Trm112 family)